MTDVQEGSETPESTAETEDSNARDTVLTVDDVGHAFGDLTVLEGVSFSADSGTVVSLVGPNGSGKSTLLRIVAGLLEPTDGAVTIATSTDRPVGYLPQTPAFRPQFSIAETLSFYGALAGVEVDLAERLGQVGLQNVPDRRVDALSGGMVRLLGIAQATIGDPPVLVLDEPSSGLDPVMVDHISSVVGELAQEGTTVLLATHNIDAVEQMAETVLVLDGAEIVDRASPDSLVEGTGAETLTGALADVIERDDTASVNVGRRGEGE